MQYSIMKQIQTVIIVSVLVSALTAHSQSIKGKLVDLVDNKPLAGATLQLRLVKDTTQSY